MGRDVATKGSGGVWWKQTRAEKESYRNALNLFFGALLGANLGLLGGLGTFDYVKLVAFLSGLVMAMQVAAAARSRRYAAVLLGSYTVLLGAGYLSGALQPPGLSDGDFAKLAATLGIWIFTIALVELTPVIEAASAGGAERVEGEPAT